MSWTPDDKHKFRFNTREMRKHRKKAGLTQVQVAYALGADISTVRNWEGNRVGLDMFIKVAVLCELLDCRPQDLFYGGKDFEKFMKGVKLKSMLV